jgi:hypothetical protein
VLHCSMAKDPLGLAGRITYLPDISPKNWSAAWRKIPARPCSMRETSEPGSAGFSDSSLLLHFITEEFSVDCYGKCSWEIERHYPYPTNEQPFNSGYSQIRADEYEAERSKFFLEAVSRRKAKETA